MICRLKQFKTSFNMSWKVWNKNEILCNVESPFETSNYTIYFAFSNGDKYRMYYNPFDKSFGKKIEDRLSFKIFDPNESLIGKFVGRTHKTGKFIGGYQFYELNLYDKQYIGYEVGRGRQGVALCLYLNNELIGIIDKNTTVINFQDDYNIYLTDSKYLEIATLFDIYYDSTKFSDVGEIALYSQKETYMVTTNKELKNKYDPNFISRIKAMDGITD